MDAAGPAPATPPSEPGSERATAPAAGATAPSDPPAGATRADRPPPGTPARPAVPAFATGPVLLTAGLVAAALLATAGRYGYHRDELYFLAAGHKLAAGYPDQPLLTPLLVRLADAAAPGSLLTLRTPGTLAAALTVLVTALTARELGGGRRAQTVAAACIGVASVTLVTGHFVTTTTFDVFFSAVFCWLVVRTTRTGDRRLLAVAGLVLGIGLLNKEIIGFLATALVVGVLLVGPRELLRGRWAAVGLALAAAGALPYLVWQARNGWPQLALARTIRADGDQGGRIGYLPFQLILVSPLLVPVWVAGLVRLLRSPDARPYRAVAVGYLLLAAVFIGTGGKAYYQAGEYPALVAAGAVAVDGWLARGATRLRTGLLTAAVALSAVVGAVVGLAVLPARDLGPVLAVNPDAGEQIGWPPLVDSVAGVWRGLPPAERAGAVLLAQNYGEAGAIARYGPADGLPYPYSGHNGFAFWGTPPASAGPVVVVGYPRTALAGRFDGCRLAATFDNGLGLDNEEQGAPVWTCQRPAVPWATLWPQLRHWG